MQIISHRGYWKLEREKNTEVAFRRSFELGFGTETDLRDLDGTIVVSHDMPTHSQKPMSFSELLEIYGEYDKHLPLLLNIKADGLQNLISETIKKFSVSNYFLFDMSVPDLLVSCQASLRCLTRHSDLEILPSHYQAAKGVWMDELLDEWISEESICNHLAESKQVFIVSPELHKRAHLEKWASYRAMQVGDSVTLCTDLPEKARSFFSNTGEV